MILVSMMRHSLTNEQLAYLLKKGYTSVFELKQHVNQTGLEHRLNWVDGADVWVVAKEVVNYYTYNSEPNAILGVIPVAFIPQLLSIINPIDVPLLQMPMEATERTETESVYRWTGKLVRVKQVEIVTEEV
jgi:hypothetical protein